MDELGYLCLLRSDKMGKAMAKLANFHVVGWAIISEDARWDIHSYTMKAAPEEFWPSGHEAPSLNLQTGHVACCLSHWSMHIQWNWWRQGRLRTSSPSLTCSRQTLHVSSWSSLGLSPSSLFFKHESVAAMFTITEGKGAPSLCWEWDVGNTGAAL
jgi:hypothetical protein